MTIAPRRMPIGGVLFDLDGTLVDSIPAVEEAWRIWAEEFGVAPPSSGQHGIRVETLVASSGVGPRDRDTAVRRLTAIEARPGQALAQMPGAARLLASLPEGAWGIVTSAARPAADARIRGARLPSPRVLVTGDDVAHGKPDPAPYRAGIDLLGANARVVAVEDTAAGAASARAAGAYVIALAGTEAREGLSEVADVVIDSLEQLSAERDGDGISLTVSPRSGG